VAEGEGAANHACLSRPAHGLSRLRSAGSCDAPSTCSDCSDSEQCCDGVCVDINGSDSNHCGGCNSVCSAGAQPACCAGQCVDLTTDATCGSCNNACGLLSLGGLACKCGSLNGALQCVGVDVGGLLKLCL
jgi:Stigma-specific protein, Stig1